ncbi:hypothetical protein EYC84_006632 [Monilinia fructicola]|uniref:Uncharacterized protein n=1 Tax=Monilinia fructicola TaxID=38448 RepID=A0A5M9K7P1_MONFR|nr:hypothetical protein EYC84_006632 [Monilinia fructicola]
MNAMKNTIARLASFDRSGSPSPQVLIVIDNFDNFVLCLSLIPSHSKRGPSRLYLAIDTYKVYKAVIIFTYS